MAESHPDIDISPAHWQIVESILAEHLGGYEVWAFGSRARHTAKPYSDLDLAVITQTPLPLSILTATNLAFEESDLPWSVDLLDWASTSAGFKALIEQDHRVVQQSGRYRVNTNPQDSNIQTRTVMTDLLDPTNDYVFKRLFAEAPDLLVDLINDLRPNLPNIESVEILNPNIEPSELTGKYIILDVLAKDDDGHCYNVEVQVRRYGAWHKRGLFYLARTLGTQLDAGEDYQHLRASVGLHLLDFDLFTDTENERKQAIWRFEMRDETQPDISLGNILQMNLIELNKADRLGLPEGSIRAWITFFKHWQEELTMANIAHEPVKKAMNRIRELSADEEARRLAFVRERALRDEVSLLNDARREEAQRILHRLLTKRFGDLPEWASQKLNSSNAQQLEDWTDEILVAKSLDELFKHES